MQSQEQSQSEMKPYFIHEMKGDSSSPTPLSLRSTTFVSLFVFRKKGGKQDGNMKKRMNITLDRNINKAVVS
jgi:hypothetical protein